MILSTGVHLRRSRRIIFAACVALLCLGFVNPASAQVSWKHIGTVTTLTANQLCYTDGTQIICDTTAPTDSAGLLGLGSTAPIVSLDMSKKTDALALPVGTTGNRPTGANLANGEIRYNSSTPGLEAYVNGSWSSLTSGGATGTGTANYDARWLTSTTLGTGAVYDNGTQVGIGTASPQAALDVNGSIDLKGSNGLWQDTTNNNLAVGGGSFIANVSQSGGGYNGQRDTAVGYTAMGGNTTGGTNTAVGYQAMGTGTITGSSNVAFGELALSAVANGSQNSGLGTRALKSMISGSGNVGVGFYSGYSNTGGAGNIYLGMYSGYNDTGSNDFFVNNVQQSSLANDKAYSLLYGTFSGTAGSLTGQQLVINGNVGIGTTSPAQKLEVSGIAQVDSGVITPKLYPSADSTTAVQINAANGTTNIVDVDTTNSRVGIGTTLPADLLENAGALRVSQSGTPANYLRLYDSAAIAYLDLTNVAGTGSPVLQVIYGNGSNYWRFGANLGGAVNVSGWQSADTSRDMGFAAATGKGVALFVNGNSPSALSNASMYINSSGSVGIGTTTPTQRLDVNGNIDAMGTNGYLTEIANAGTTGTTVNALAKLNTSGNAVITTTSDTDGVVGVVVGSAGISGNAQIAVSGQASCAFDGATTAGDYVTLSTTTGGDCHDAGATRSTSAQTIGRVLSTNAGSGTYAMTVKVDASALASGVPTGTGTANYDARWLTSTTLGTGAVYDNGTQVGIGTTSPAYQLEVNGSIAASTLVGLTGTSWYTGLKINTTHGQTGTVTGVLSQPIYTNAGVTTARSIYAANPTASGSGTAQNVQALYIDNVSGGTTSNANIAIGATPSSGNYGIYDSSAGNNYFAGNVGIGTTSPSGMLDVEGGTAAASTNGTSIKLVAQSAGSGNQNGGNIILTPGVATGTGSAGGVGIGTSTIPASVTANINGLVKVAGTGSEPCTASQVGSMRYNPTGNYFELCSYP